MARTIKDLYDEIQHLVDTGGVYRFEPVVDEDDEIIEGTPVSVSSGDLFVKLAKATDYAKVGEVIAIDVDDYQLMDVVKVG